MSQYKVGTSNRGFDLLHNTIKNKTLSKDENV